VLNELDEEVAAAGGRLYLAKDSRQSGNILRRCYPRLPEWEEYRQKAFSEFKFFSELSRRGGIWRLIC